MQGNRIEEFLPRYHQVRLAVERYLSGLEVGSRVMTERELIDKFQISRVTARRALQTLRKEGVLDSVPGRGTFLARKVAVPSQPAEARQLALLLPFRESLTFGLIARGVEGRARARGYQIVLAYDGDNPEDQISRIREMARSGVAGLFIYPDRTAIDMPEFFDALGELEKLKIPVVLLDRYAGGRTFPVVMVDNVRGMYEATEHLILLGRRRLALLGLWSGNLAHTQRRKGFFDALNDYGISTRKILEAETKPDQMVQAAHDAVVRWVGNKAPAELPFDGIVCMHDPLAFGAFMALRERNISVPSDVALVGFDNLNDSLYQTFGLHLTSVEQPLKEIGTHAADLLIDIIEKQHKSSRAAHVLLPPHLVVRTSCGSKGPAAPPEAPRTVDS
jgi:DNA-binding LacI/PurR family transcriptional regulator